MKVIKAGGLVEEFKPEKLAASLRRAGAPGAVAQEIVGTVEKGAHDGMHTREIYAQAFALLRRGRRVAAARYSLKRALFEFGPSGFPFESYIAELFRAEGAQALVDQIVKGACVEHEVDVVVTREDKIVLYGEAKFHNTPGLKSDLKTALYVQARIEDLLAAGHAGVKGLLVTNTKFTDKAVEYAQCKGLELLGWDYPQGATLHERIDRAGLYPVTALTLLSKREKMALMESRFVLCKALPEHPGVLAQAGVESKRAAAVLEEVGALCVPGSDI